jgi:biotin carboxyl carrier protein
LDGGVVSLAKDQKGGREEMEGWLDGRLDGRLVEDRTVSHDGEKGKLMKYIATIGEREFVVEIIDERHIRVGERLLEVNFESVSGQPVYSLIVNGKSFESYVYQGEDTWQVLLRGHLYPVSVEDEREKRLRAAGSSSVVEGGEFQLKAPMPGMVVAVPVAEGQAVEKGQVLAVLESMKMQNELKAPRAGVVGRIKVKAGESVEQKQMILSMQ